MVGHLKHDQYTLMPVGGLTHYLGDAIALVVAQTTRRSLEKAKKLVKVDYEVLPAVHNPVRGVRPRTRRTSSTKKDQPAGLSSTCAAATPTAAIKQLQIRHLPPLRDARGPSMRSWSRSARSAYIDQDGDVMRAVPPTSRRTRRCTNARCCSAPTKVKVREPACRRRLRRQGRYERCSTTRRSSPT